jgi:CubicO group peptidase (beta-lactamase class C family)
MTNEQRLPRSRPEDQGVDPEAITRLAQALDDLRAGPHSLMVVRHGTVVGEGWWRPYEASRPHIMFSISKSFTATAIGLAQDEGLLSVDEPVLDFFPSYATAEVRHNVAGLKLRHVLAMATGHAVDTMTLMRALPEEDWVKIFLESPIVYPPGSRFLYNSGASFVLAVIVASRTGRQPLDYLAPRLFEPLGIPLPPWEANPRGINLGASGLRLRTEDVAKFGLLYLRRGLWGDRRILSERWVDEATTAHVSNGTGDSDWEQGYGFQFWRSRHGFRADGAYGQFSLVVPEHDLVVAITSGSNDNRAIPRVVWENLLPGVHDDPKPLPVTGLLGHSLALGDRSVPVPDFLPGDPPVAAKVTGRPIAVPFNLLGVTSLVVTFDGDAITLRTCGGQVDETVRAGRHDWALGATSRWPHEEMSEVTVAARGGWTAPDTLELHWQLTDTPFRRVWRLRFGDLPGVHVSVGLDMGFWEENVEELDGRLD